MQMQHLHCKHYPKSTELAWIYMQLCKFPCSLTKQLWERPHYELDKNVTLQEFNMCGPSNKGVDASAVGGNLEVNVTAHDHTLLGVSSDLVQAIV